MQDLKAQANVETVNSKQHVHSHDYMKRIETRTKCSGGLSTTPSLICTWLYGRRGHNGMMIPVDSISVLYPCLNSAVRLKMIQMLRPQNSLSAPYCTVLYCIIQHNEVERCNKKLAQHTDWNCHLFLMSHVVHGLWPVLLHPRLQLGRWSGSFLLVLFPRSRGHEDIVFVAHSYCLKFPSQGEFSCANRASLQHYWISIAPPSLLQDVQHSDQEIVNSGGKQIERKFELLSKILIRPAVNGHLID